MNIDDMKPGRELDALVAERVMGECAHDLHAYVKDNRNNDSDYIQWRCRKCKKAFAGMMYSGYGDTGKPLCKPYSTDIAAAWQVVEKMSYFEVQKESGYWDATVAIEGFHSFHGGVDTAPHAICLAALKAMEASEG